MEPLRDLAVLKKWDRYVPSITGYTATPPGHVSDTDVCALLGCLERLKPKGTIAGAHVMGGAPFPGIVVKNKALPVPMNDSDFKFLVESGDVAAGQGAYLLGQDKVRIANTLWLRAAEKGSKKAMKHAKMDPELMKKAKLVGMTVVEPQVGDGHSLDTRSESENHLATVFVVLPSQRSSATFEARHQGLTVIHDLTASALFAPHFLVCYPGTEHATLKVQGAHLAYLTYQLYVDEDFDLPPLLDDLSPGPRADVAAAFAGWARALAEDSSGGGIPKEHVLYQLDAVYIKKETIFHKMKSGANATSITNTKDRLVLSHLAPAAKHFNFRILLGHACITQSTSIFRRGYYHRDDWESEVEHDANDYDLDDGRGIETEINWVLTGLDGKVIKDETLDKELVDTLTARVEKEKLKEGERNCILNYHVDTDPLDEKDMEEGTLTHGKTASFFIIGPTPPGHVSWDSDDSEGGGSDDDNLPPTKRRHVDLDHNPPPKRRRVQGAPSPTQPQCAMEPLRELVLLANWSEYVPSTAWYTRPSREVLDEANIMELFKYLPSCEPRAGVTADPEALPSPCVVVGQKTLSVPMSALDFDFLLRSGDLEQSGEFVWEASADKVQIQPVQTNELWDHRLRRVAISALGPPEQELYKDIVLCSSVNLSGLTVVTPPVDSKSYFSHALDVGPHSDDHIASIFVVLPSPLKFAEFEVDHHKHGISFTLDEDQTSSCPKFLTSYTNTEAASLRLFQKPTCYLTYHLLKKNAPQSATHNLSDATLPRPQIATAFAAWAKHQARRIVLDSAPTGHVLFHLNETYRTKDTLSTEVVDVGSITDADDKLILGYLAPPAKYFGFRILLAHAVIPGTATFRVARKHGLVDGRMYKVEDYNLDSWGESESEFVVEWTLTGLDGQEVEGSDALCEGLTSTLLNKIDEDIKDAGLVLNDYLDQVKFGEKELEFDEDQMEDDVDVLELTCKKRASFLVIGPEDGCVLSPPSPTPFNHRFTAERSMNPVKRWRQAQQSKKGGAWW
ncbi:hypothetical protein D9611_011405 [Ephemerocybe angulata]|uniref:Uncharacterized protein n=1 Tax=Ephemerocybe angulata TaxID=980116 RepID=A0A8H5CFM1_9AGAR|nr:hypothetical protein D9611_011405 [Tulosesus angulatus]